MSKMKNLFTSLSDTTQTKILSGQIKGNKYLKPKKPAKKNTVTIEAGAVDLKKASGNDFT